jgi:hypothetical protein
MSGGLTGKTTPFHPPSPSALQHSTPIQIAAPVVPTPAPNLCHLFISFLVEVFCFHSSTIFPPSTPPKCPFFPLLRLSPFSAGNRLVAKEESITSDSSFARSESDVGDINVFGDSLGTRRWSRASMFGWRRVKKRVTIDTATMRRGQFARYLFWNQY